MSLPRTLLRCVRRSPAGLRLNYSSSSTSKRLLQTSTYTRPATALTHEPPMPRGAGVASSLTNPGNESTATATTTTSSSSSEEGWRAPPAPPKQPAPPPPTSQASRTPAAPTQKRFRARKAAMALSPTAVAQLRRLMDQPEPKMIRVGVKNRGCSGLAYHLEYVDRPGKFDDEVVQDGVRVLIDSKALFSIIGSEMDWVEDKLSARFVFKNPNIKEQCGCGESFSVG